MGSARKTGQWLVPFAAVQRAVGRNSLTGVGLYFSRVGSGNDLADSGLVETFEPVISFQDFKVRADGSVSTEFFGLAFTDLSPFQ